MARPTKPPSRARARARKQRRPRSSPPGKWSPRSTGSPLSTPSPRRCTTTTPLCCPRLGPTTRRSSGLTARCSWSAEIRPVGPGRRAGRDVARRGRPTGEVAASAVGTNQKEGEICGTTSAHRTAQCGYGNCHSTFPSLFCLHTAAVLTVHYTQCRAVPAIGNLNRALADR